MLLSPFRVQNPEFKCSPSQEYCLEAELAISPPDSGNKWNRKSSLNFRIDQMAGYEIQAFIRMDGEDKWHKVTSIGEITIVFSGDYEIDTLKDFFQHTALMMKPVYGNAIIGKEQDDAIHEDTPSV